MPYADKIAPLVNEGKAKPKLQVKTPLGCHLQTISGVGGCFAWGGGKYFDSLLERGHGEGGFGGDYFTATIISIQIPAATTIKELKERGFKLLGTQKGSHGNYRMALYGKGFK